MWRSSPPSCFFTHLDFLLEKEALVHGGQGCGGCLIVGIFDEGIRIVARLPDNFTALDRAHGAEEGDEQVLGHGAIQIAHIQGLGL